MAFVMASAQAHEHDYIAPEARSTVLVATRLAGAGETVDATFAARSTRGSYTFFCSFPGHYLAGMKGTLVVK
jgi:azurin